MAIMGNRIKEKRLELKLTQDELGEKLGVKKAAVNKWESGAVQNIKRSTIQRMSELFDVSPSYLMGFSDVPSSDNIPNSNLYPSNEKAKHDAIRQKKIDQLNPDELQLVDNLIDTLIKNHNSN